MDNVVSSLVVFEGNGQVVEYVGGYNDWQSSGGVFYSEEGKKQKLGIAEAGSHGTRKREKNAQRKKEKELEQLPEKIEILERQVVKFHDKMSDPTFFDITEVEQKQLYKELAETEEQLKSHYERWEELG